jgi:hypothetical protein
MTYDRTLNLSFLISLSLHLLVVVITSVLFVQPVPHERPRRVVEVEIVSSPRQKPTHLTKRRPPSKRLKISRQKEVSHKVSSLVARLREERMRIGAVLRAHGGEEMAKLDGAVQYGILAEEVGEEGPLFERVERGMEWGEGPITTSEVIQKGKPLIYKIGEGTSLENPSKIKPLEEKEKIKTERRPKREDRYPIEGPAEERKILYQKKIPLPDWVEREGRSLRARFKFWVLPSGWVDRVEKIETFGYPEIDDLALKTIRCWRFSEGEEEVWGIVSIRIQLN